ncbi:hypothetical protein GQ602_005409 [Ophiocordyceps camponoti-floridani]|uniref:C2H2-type domain-containing protein n=1 Tax=Ophiocordyceps camponoti-floridani TaxID=2030778 RepID=A0A8H4VBU4_9HYPO|nr:hypothetical protein GQ602_005409 [Ophiocordyceps camponoti-floridani]
MDCAICRTPAPFVIFTDDVEKRFEDYSDADITTTDANVGIKYSNEDIVGDTVLLLRYNCPDASCDFAGLGWPDLHRHVKAAHGKRMCDLCTRNKKVFTHEHELFDDAHVDKHMRRGDDRPNQTGFKGHPLCEFCSERFYDDDRLYEHCRTKHERCFICDRSDPQKPHYYRDYDALEKHFRRDHFPCLNRECLDNKFVVFESRLDLQAHAISAHPGETASRDARLVDMSSFDIRQSYQQERRPTTGRGGSGAGQRDDGGRGGNRGRGGGRGGRGRDPNAGPEPAPVLSSSISSAQPLRRDELAFQRQMAIHSAQSVSNRTFGGQLTGSTGRGASSTASPAASSRTSRRAAAAAAAAAAASTNNDGISQEQQQPPATETASMAPEVRARLVRHNAVIERAANMVANDASKLTSFRNHISSYRQGTLTAPQLLDAFFTLFADVSSNALGTLVREVADLFDERAKADGLRAAWQNWRAINEDYPSLPGLSGMRGATSSSSGWASAAAASPALPLGAPAQRFSSRVLRLKNSTRLGGDSTASTPSSAFPSLPPPFPAPIPITIHEQPLLVGNSSLSAGPINNPTNKPPHAPHRQDNHRPNGRRLPALPAAPKPATTIFGRGSSGRGVRRDFGRALNETGFQWGAAGAAPPPPPPPSSSSGAGAAGAAAAVGDDMADGVEERGRGKKKGKRVLVQWG